MNISSKIESLIYGVNKHSINQGCWKCERCKDGVTEVQWKTQQGNVYMNEEHREAGSERNKRQDFTIDSVQGQKLITTKFKGGSLVPGILEVVWRWQR